MPTYPKAGSIGLSHTDGAMGILIRLGEWIRFRKGCRFNHAFLVSDELDERGVPYVIQATMRGVTNVTPFDQMAGFVEVYSLPKGTNAKRTLEFAKAQVGIEYGFFTIFAIAFDILTWNWVPSLRGARKPSWICSALVFESLRYGGFLRNVIDIYEITPSEIFTLVTE